MPKSSTRSGAVFVPRRERSRLALVFRVLEHALALAGIVATGWPCYVKFAALLLLTASLWLSRPARTTTMLVSASGEWSLPGEALYGMRLLPGTQFTRAWGLLRFVAADGRRRDLAVWSDTLSRADWRRLRIWLREHR